MAQAYYDLAMRAGLVDGGLNEDGEQEYIGTVKEWQEFERLQEELNN